MLLTRIPAHRARIAALAMSAALLAACATPAPSNHARDGREPHPIVVESQVVTQAVAFVENDQHIDPASLPQLDSFVDGFLHSGGGVLEIAMASDGASDELTQRRQKVVRRHVLRRGVRPHELRFSQLRSSTGRNGSVVVSYERFTARAPDCKKFIVDNTFNPTNEHHPNFGCTIQAEIAAMIANPADLTRSRTEQPSDGVRRSWVIQKYRAGEATESARGANEQASSIRDLN